MSGIIIICGPTAIGKTSISISVAESFDGEIVGADSMQVYRQMNIGTAKPSPEERARVRHHMIDVADPDESYDAARFSREARAAVSDIHSRKRLPIAAGGTGLYIKAMLYGLCDAVPEDASVRVRLRDEAARGGGELLHERLRHCDPEASARIHPNDTYRIIRALEVFEITGCPMSDYRRRHHFSDAPYNALKIGLEMDRDALYARIDARVDRMIAEGLLAEVENLLDRGFNEDLRPMKSLGYRHMTDFLKGRSDWKTAVDILKRDTRRYAKRQFTWFKADREIQWFKPTEFNKVDSLIRAFRS